MTLRNLVNVKEEMLELYGIDLVLGRVISACKNQSWCFVPKKKNNVGVCMELVYICTVLSVFI